MIDWNKYQAEALTTAIYPLERELDYTILGLCSEVAEVAELALLISHADQDARLKEFKSELGDCFWYVAAVADAIKVPLEGVWESRLLFEQPDEMSVLVGGLVTWSGKLAGLAKKAIRDDAGKVTPERHRQIVIELGKVLMALDHFSVLIGSSSHAVTQANLNKLSDRKQRGVLQGSGNVR